MSVLPFLPQTPKQNLYCCVINLDLELLLSYIYFSLMKINMQRRLWFKSLK